jgi:hypothetical protein
MCGSSILLRVKLTVRLELNMGLIISALSAYFSQIHEMFGNVCLVATPYIIDNNVYLNIHLTSFR